MPPLLQHVGKWVSDGSMPSCWNGWCYGMGFWCVGGGGGVLLGAVSWGRKLVLLIRDSGEDGEDGEG